MNTLEIDGDRREMIHTLVKQAASEGIEIRINGDCMEPMLADGRLVQVKSRHQYWPGDILVYRDQNSRMVAHRLLGYYRSEGQWRLLIQADNALGPDMGVCAEAVIGRIEGVNTPIRHRLRAFGRFLRYALIDKRIRKNRREYAGAAE